jgi:hypothetical protein
MLSGNNMRDAIAFKNPVKNDKLEKLEKATPVRLEEIVARLNAFWEATVVDRHTENYNPLDPKDGLWISSTELFVAPKKSARNIIMFEFFAEKVKRAIEVPHGDDREVLAIREDEAKVIARQEVGDFSTLKLPSLYYLDSVCSDRVEHHLEFPDERSTNDFKLFLHAFGISWESSDNEIKFYSPKQPLLKSIIVRICPDVETAAAAALGKLENARRLGEWEAKDIKSAFRFNLAEQS